MEYSDLTVAKLFRKNLLTLYTKYKLNLKQVLSSNMCLHVYCLNSRDDRFYIGVITA